MAESIGFLDSLGIGVADEEDILKAQREAILSQGNSGKMRALGQSGGAALGGLASGVAGLVTGNNDGRSPSGFFDNVGRGASNVREGAAAQNAGITVEQLRSRRKIRSLQAKYSSDSSFESRSALLRDIISISNKAGDTEVVAAAMAKLQQLKEDEIEFASLKTEREVELHEQSEQLETDSTGRTLRLVSEDPQGPTSQGTFDPLTNTWDVIDSKGNISYGVNPLRIVLTDPVIERAAAAVEARGDDETDLLIKALKVNGLTGQTPDKKRVVLIDMATQASIVSDMTGTLIGMWNPAVAFSDSQALATGSDRVFSFIETFSSLFSRKGSMTAIKYDGKKVSIQEQYAKGTNQDILDEFYSEKGLSFRDMLPPHIQADTEEAQLFRANVMQLAYLDARLQEPSNRGLSDNDIKAALDRIGVGSPNPAVFARRQQQTLTRLKGRMASLGLEFSGINGYSQKKLIDFIYNKEFRNGITEVLDAGLEDIALFLKEGGRQSGDERDDTDALDPGTGIDLDIIGLDQLYKRDTILPNVGPGKKQPTSDEQIQTTLDFFEDTDNG